MSDRFLSDVSQEQDNDDQNKDWRILTRQNYMSLLNRSQAFEEMMDMYDYYQQYGHHGEQVRHQIQFSDLQIEDVPSDPLVPKQDDRQDSSSNPNVPEEWFGGAEMEEAHIEDRFQNIENQLNLFSGKFDAIERRRQIRLAGISLSLTIVGLVGVVSSIGFLTLSPNLVSTTFLVFVSAVLGIVAIGLLLLGAFGFHRSVYANSIQSFTD